MPVPLPGPDTALLLPPDAAEAAAIARGVASAIRPAEGLTDFQRLLTEAVVAAMTSHPVSLEGLVPYQPRQFAEVLAPRTLPFRTRIVQNMILGALVLRPLPAEVVARIDAFAAELGVEEGMLAVARRFAAGSLGLAALDFERNGYTSEWHAEDARSLHTSGELASAWDQAVHDPALAERWAALGELPSGTLGRGVWELYRARGFVFPGRPGSAPPLLAQHDWVHVLADYGTTVESELEVFALVARADDDMHGFSLLAMVVALFETGYLRTGAGLFESDLGHLSSGHHMAARVADAMRRGALAHDTRTDHSGVDLLRLDWFELAPLPVEEAREVLHVVAKSEAAVAAGSPGPWDPGGISPFQQAAGRAMAEADGVPYDAHGACVLEPEAIDP